MSKRGRRVGSGAWLLISLLAGHAAPAQDRSLPHLEKRGAATQLIVDGKPFLVLGGELHNSSSSSAAYMKPVWPQLVAMHMNTVLLPVAWETIEPQEGQFDFSLVDQLLQDARANHLKLVLLWFGTWKNTYSSYVPAWVKRDQSRFPRVQTSNGQGTERISPFSKSAADADIRAFSRLMRHLHETDREDHTVLMVQVENEVGVIPESRDFSPTANAAFAAPVPAALLTYIAAHRQKLEVDFRANWEAQGARTAGSWQEVFGKGSFTNDLFMAWHYATYIERVTAAGKAEYSLPMFANAALIRPNYEPGQYNSGGPLPHSADVWKAGAPSLDFLSPDIYFNEFESWSQRYARPGNILFIPETQGGSAGAANALYAFGQLSAVGFSAFGIDDQGNAPLDLVGITDPSQSIDKTALSAAYGRLAQLAPLILEKQQGGAIAGVLIESEAQRAGRVRIGDYIATVTRAGNPSRTGGRIGVMFLQTGPDAFTVLGSGDAQVTFSSEQPGAGTVGLESIDEAFYREGSVTPGRRLNGDENSQGQALRLFASDAAEGKVYRVRLYHYR